ncbi:hypothetical protein [Novosphingobium sp.]|uniref:hypothetical protein n=1 Tax=Novosphingobium sp. TaxID=1874826 RepID=UPI0031CDB330
MVVHSMAWGLMALCMGLTLLWIAGHELVSQKAEHVSLFFQRYRRYGRREQPLAYWIWVVCHGLGGLVMAGCGVAMLR